MTCEHGDRISDELFEALTQKYPDLTFANREEGDKISESVLKDPWLEHLKLLSYKNRSYVKCTFKFDVERGGQTWKDSFSWWVAYDNKYNHYIKEHNN